VSAAKRSKNLEHLMGLRVFLVEDSQNIEVLLRELFACIGSIQIVATARTEAEANLWLDDHGADWDLTIVDLVLDQGSGFSVIRRARRSRALGKIVVLSGFASAGIRENCFKLGASAVFDKAQTSEFVTWLDAQVRDRLAA
jgi:two-component system response regulator TctD